MVVNRASHPSQKAINYIFESLLINKPRSLNIYFEGLKEKAKKSYDNCNYKEAFELYKVLVANVGYLPDLLDKLTMSALYTRMYEPVITIFELKPFYKKLPAVILSRIGFAYNKLGDYAKAYKLIVDSLLLKKNQPVAMLTLSQVMLQMGNMEGAYETVNLALLLDNKNTEAKVLLSKILSLAEKDKFTSHSDVTNLFSPDVAIGNKENVFLLGGAHKIKDYVRGEVIPQERSVKNFYNNIISRARFCLKKEIQYAHVVFPDKQSILIDEFPYKQKYTLTDYYLSQKKYSSTCEHDLPIVYPLSNLINRNNIPGINNEVTIKGDSHLSDVGYLIVIKSILESIEPLEKENFMEVLLDKEMVQFEEKLWTGDLAVKFNPPKTSTRLLYKHKNDLKPIENGIFSNDGLVRFWHNKVALSDKTVLIFGDSYFNFISRYLSLIYSKVYFCRTRFFHDEVVNEISPDILLTGNAERYLSFVSSDEQAGCFNDYYKNLSLNEPSYQYFSKRIDSEGFLSLLKPKLTR